MCQNSFHRKAVSLRRLYTIGAITLLVTMLVLQEGALAAAAKQKAFPSPEAAVNALVQAIRESRTGKLIRILGPGSETFVLSGDDVQDRQHRERFTLAYEERNRLEPGVDGSVQLIIGKDNWPFPFPLVKAGQRWRFDTRAGKEEVLNRHIGKNELDAIQVCLAIADAQKDYAELMTEQTGSPEYALKFNSSEGKKDGLYWEVMPGDKPSPLGPLVARARAEGYTDVVGRSVPYHGYLYKILTAQGESANGGAHSYRIDGKMIGGFAVAAFPAVYGSSGRHTFIVNHEGVVYGKDLGKNTAGIVLDMTAFNPDATWKIAE